jgi:hypothetical protein
MHATSTRLHTATGNMLTIYDCTNPAALVEVSRYILDGRPRDVERAGDYVYVALGERGVEIIDVTNESAPVQAYSLGGGTANDLTVSEGVLYIVWNGDLRLHDVTDPTSPGWLSTTPLGGARFVGVRNQRALVATQTSPFTGELVTVNCTNSSGPTVVNTILLFRPPVAMTTRPGLLVLAVEETLFDKSLHIFDISAPASPTLQSTRSVTDGSLGMTLDFGQSQGVNMLYCRGELGSLVAYNLANPANPTLVPTPPMTRTASISANPAGGVFVAGYGQMRGLTSDATAGLTLAGLTSVGPVGSVATLRSGDHVVSVADYEFVVYDTTNPSAPARVGDPVVDFNGPIWGAAIDGESLFVIEGSRFRQYDLSNPAAPVLVGEDELRNFGYDLDVEGTLACVTTYDTLDVYRVGDPSSISRRSRVQLTDDPDAVILREQTAIVQTESGILFFDLADPNVPVQVGSWPPPAGGIRDMVLRDDLLFVSCSTGRIDAVDITNPANPQSRGALDPGVMGYLSLVDSLVVVSRPGFFDAQIIDWADPDSPVLLPQILRTADTIVPGCGVGLDGALFAMTAMNGVEVYDLPGHPRVVRQPEQTAACANSTQVQFTVEVAEPAGTTYRWRRNGTPMVSGATGWGSTVLGAFTATLTLSNPRIQDLAAYDCVITNGCGTATTQVAALVPGVLPNEVIPPADVFVCPRGETTLSVGWLGSNPATFQWQAEFPAGSGTWTNLSDGDLARTFIEGAQTRFLTVGARAGLTMNAFVETDYRCIITNTCGTTTSSSGSITLCIGDYDCSAGVDGDDVIAFFADWDAGLSAADVDGSGGVDGDDVIAFFGAWDGGC